MRFARSIHTQLLIWLMIAQGIIGLLSLADTYFSARQTADTAYDRVLSNSALTIAERTYVDEDGALNVDIPYVALEMLASNASDRVYYRVDSAGVLVTGYDQLNVPADVNGTEWQYGDLTIRGEAVRYVSLSKNASNGLISLPYRVIVAETQNARNALTRSIFLRSLLRLLAIMLGSFLIIWIAISYALRPLQRLSQAIGRRSPTDLRAIEHSVPTEVEGLVGETNALMRRLDTALDALKRFTSNASHQLRTPMAVAHTELSLAKRASDIAAKNAGIERGLSAITGAEHTLSQLLMLARLSENQSNLPEFSVFDLYEIAQEICGQYAIQSQRKNIQLSFDGQPGSLVTGDQILIGEAIKNLLENALTHPENCTQIYARLTRSANQISLSITNDGVAPNRNFERRLGLSIVEDIVNIFNGVLEIDASSEAEFIARITFPRQKG